MSVAEGRHGAQDVPSETEPAAAPPRHSVRRRQSVKIAILLLIIFDVLVGFVAKDVSAKHEELAQIQQASAQLIEANGRTLLVIGGTAAGAGIDPVGLSQALDRDESDWTGASIPISGATIAVWSAVYDQHVARAARQPDIVVFGFVNDELEDQNHVDWTTIGNLHTSRKSLGDRWDSAPDLSSKLDVIGSWASSMVGNRDWLFDIFSAAIPNHGSVPRQTPGQADEAHTFTILTAALEAIATDGPQIAVVALPTQRSYPLPDDLRPAVEASGALFIDLRLDGQLPEDQFVSSASLDAAGAAEVSARLAAQLNARLE